MSMIILTYILVTAATLIYVFYLPGTLHLGPEKTQVAYLRERKEVIYENLRDLNFEFKAGKFPEADYQAMKNSLEEEAAALLSEISHLEETGRGPGVAARRKKGIKV
jgi:hypothetical protein